MNRPNPEFREKSVAMDGDPEALYALLEASAAPEDAGHRSIGKSLAHLRQAGWLLDDGAVDPRLSATRLRRVAAVNLSVGRLWEGHMNALYLALVHGDARSAAQVAALVKGGALLGVWGADGETPVVPGADGTALTGTKVYASGLGTVTHAVVTVSSGSRVRLGLVDVRDMSRADTSVWRMQGMRATASGRYDFEGIPLCDILWLGGPGDYLNEPHFVGGVWRIAALQIGAAAGLLDAASSVLRERGRLEAPAQMARLSSCAIRVLAASALTNRAAMTAMPGASYAPSDVAAISAAARLSTEETALDAIRTVEQCLGLSHFEDDAATGRKARDLAVYLRQAARDAFQTRIGEACFEREGGLWTLL